jgi:predicted DNA-binding protein
MAPKMEDPMSSGNKERIRLTIDLDPVQHQRAKILAAHQGRALADVVREMLDEWIEDAVDIEISEGIYERLRAGGPALTHKEVWAKFANL